LRDLLIHLEDAHKITLTQFHRSDLVLRGGTAAFEYRATRRVHAKDTP